jgi:hypothetical protein
MTPVARTLANVLLAHHRQRCLPLALITNQVTDDVIKASTIEYGQPGCDIRQWPAHVRNCIAFQGYRPKYRDEDQDQPEPDQRRSEAVREPLLS